MPLPLPLINGQRCDAASYTITINGLRYFGVKSLDYSDTLEPGKVKGTSPVVLGRTVGSYDASGSIELYVEEALDLETQLSGMALAQYPQGGGHGLGQAVFSINVSVYELSTGFGISDTLVGCRVKNISHTMPTAGGGDPGSKKFDLDILSILRNGRSMLVTPVPIR